LTSHATSQKQNPLSTKRKSPSVRSVIGRVRMSRTGRTKPLTRPRSTAAASAGTSPSTSMPGRMDAARMIASALTTTRSRNPICPLRSLSRWTRSVAAYTGRAVRQHHYRPLWLASLCVTLVSAAAGAAESRHVSIDPALVRGSADAPVTIVEFSDYQVASCKRAQPVLEQVLQEFKGKVRLVHNDFPA